MFIEEQNGLTLKNGLKKIYKNKRYSEMDTFFYFQFLKMNLSRSQFCLARITNTFQEPNIITQLELQFTGKKKFKIIT